MSNWDQLGDGAVQSSVEDLAKWEANFGTATVGGPRLIELLTTRGRLNDGSDIDYTAGLSRSAYRGTTRLSHGGAWAGYRAQVTRFPAEQVGILLTCNRADAATGSLADKVADIFVRLDAPRAINPAKGDRHEGFFVSNATGTTRTFQMRGDTLTVGSSHTLLSAVSPGEFVNATATARYRFTGDRLIVTALGDVADTLQRTARVNHLPREALGAYIGVYASPEVAIAYEVAANDTALFLHRAHGDDIPLAPVHTDAFVSTEAGGAFDAFGAVHFVRDGTGRVVAMSVTGRGIHDLRLLRQP